MTAGVAEPLVSVVVGVSSEPMGGLLVISSKPERMRDHKNNPCSEFRGLAHSIAFCLHPTCFYTHHFPFYEKFTRWHSN